MIQAHDASEECGWHALLKCRRGKIHLSVSVRVSTKSACGCPKGALLLLDTADALCEAKCEDQGSSAKSIRCFGPNVSFRG
jgi:hypothetical protein